MYGPLFSRAKTNIEHTLQVTITEVSLLFFSLSLSDLSFILSALNDTGNNILYPGTKNFVRGLQLGLPCQTPAYSPCLLSLVACSLGQVSVLFLCCALLRVSKQSPSVSVVGIESSSSSSSSSLKPGSLQLAWPPPHHPLTVHLHLSPHLGSLSPFPCSPDAL